MQKYGARKFVFSSSATIYGVQESTKYVETMKKGTPSNPYGMTKLMIEDILEDLYKSDNSWKISILRYFNPVGAHESGLIGENPKGRPNNLMPFIQKVATKELDELTIFGNDYNTPDGTCRRDYIHVVDLAKGHLKALEKLENSDNGVYIYNLGTGNPVSVLEIVNTFMKVNNIDVPYKIGPRRAGDLDEFYADPTKAEKELNWKAEKTLEDMCRDSWNFAKGSINLT
jgi:UDP-glucose 4-epimerase